MKKFILMSLIMLLTFTNHIYAYNGTGINDEFEKLFQKSKAMEKYKLDMKTDGFKVIEAKIGENTISSYYGIIKKYGLYVTFDERLKHEIIQETSSKKAILGNEIAAAAHLLELNTKKSNYKKIQLAVLKGKQDYDLAKRNYGKALELLRNAQKSLELGKGTQLEVELAQNNCDLASHELDVKAQEWDYYSKLLSYFLGENFLVEPEKKIETKIEDLEYYLKAAQGRFEILMRKKQNQMDALEIDIYEEKFDILSPVQKDEFTLKSREVQKREEEIKQFQLLIGDEITRGYHVLMDKNRALDSFSQKVKNLKKRNEQMKELLNKGKISRTDYTDFELKYLEAEYGYQLMIMDYNNFYRDFIHATSVGPKLSF